MTWEPNYDAGTIIWDTNGDPHICGGIEYLGECMKFHYTKYYNPERYAKFLARRAERLREAGTRPPSIP